MPNRLPYNEARALWNEIKIYDEHDEVQFKTKLQYLYDTQQFRPEFFTFFNTYSVHISFDGSVSLSKQQSEWALHVICSAQDGAQWLKNVIGNLHELGNFLEQKGGDQVLNVLKTLGLDYLNMILKGWKPKSLRNDQHLLHNLIKHPEYLQQFPITFEHFVDINREFMRYREKNEYQNLFMGYGFLKIIRELTTCTAKDCRFILDTLKDKVPGFYCIAVLSIIRSDTVITPIEINNAKKTMLNRTTLHDILTLIPEFSKDFIVKLLGKCIAEYPDNLWKSLDIDSVSYESLLNLLISKQPWVFGKTVLNYSVFSKIDHLIITCSSEKDHDRNAFFTGFTQNELHDIYHTITCDEPRSVFIDGLKTHRQDVIIDAITAPPKMPGSWPEKNNITPENQVKKQGHETKQYQQEQPKKSPQVQAQPQQTTPPHYSIEALKLSMAIVDIDANETLDNNDLVCRSNGRLAFAKNQRFKVVLRNDSAQTLGGWIFVNKSPKNAKTFEQYGSDHAASIVIPPNSTKILKGFNNGKSKHNDGSGFGLEGDAAKFSDVMDGAPAGCAGSLVLLVQRKSDPKPVYYEYSDDTLQSKGAKSKSLSQAAIRPQGQHGQSFQSVTMEFEEEKYSMHVWFAIDNEKKAVMDADEESPFAPFKEEIVTHNNISITAPHYDFYYAIARLDTSHDLLSNQDLKILQPVTITYQDKKNNKQTKELLLNPLGAAMLFRQVDQVKALIKQHQWVITDIGNLPELLQLLADTKNSKTKSATEEMLTFLGIQQASENLVFPVLPATDNLVSKKDNAFIFPVIKNAWLITPLLNMIRNSSSATTETQSTQSMAQQILNAINAIVKSESNSLIFDPIITLKEILSGYATNQDANMDRLSLLKIITAQYDCFDPKNEDHQTALKNISKILKTDQVVIHALAILHRNHLGAYSDQLLSSADPVNASNDIKNIQGPINLTCFENILKKYDEAIKSLQGVKAGMAI